MDVEDKYNELYRLVKEFVDGKNLCYSEYDELVDFIRREESTNPTETQQDND